MKKLLLIILMLSFSSVCFAVEYPGGIKNPFTRQQVNLKGMERVTTPSEDGASVKDETVYYDKAGTQFVYSSEVYTIQQLEMAKAQIQKNLEVLNDPKRVAKASADLNTQLSDVTAKISAVTAAKQAVGKSE